MKQVVIHYTSGENIKFKAQEFDIDIKGDPQTYGAAIWKFTYKAADGNDTPIYLKPDSVAGIVVISE